jgi:hypothetical protein
MNLDPEIGYHETNILWCLKDCVSDEIITSVFGRTFPFQKEDTLDKYKLLKFD